MPPKDQISRVAKMLGDEYGTASNIKSRVNRLSVLSAITSAQQRLKLYTKVCTSLPSRCSAHLSPCSDCNAKLCCTAVVQFDTG